MKSLIFIFVVAAVIALAVGLQARIRSGMSASLHHAAKPEQERGVEDAVGEEGKIFSNQYLTVAAYGDGSVSVYFNVESDVPFEIGEKMEAINENAYMNGEAWTSLLNFIMKERCPELLKDMQTDSEAGTYVAYYPDSEEGRAKARRLGMLIVSLIENENELYDIVRRHGDEIEWE